MVGDPNSGKSVFLNLLYRYLISKGYKVVMQEGDLTAPTQWWSLSNHGKVIRKAIKEKLSTQERLKWVLNALENFRNGGVDIVLVDVGGGLPQKGIRVTPENREILKKCGYAIIVSRNDHNQIEKWIYELKTKVPGIKILCAIESRLKCKSYFDRKINTGVICNLDRELLVKGNIPKSTLKVVALVGELITKLKKMKVSEMDVNCFTKFIFGSANNLSSKTAISNIPVCIWYPKEGEDKILRESKHIRTLAVLTNPYQQALLILYRHPVYGFFLEYRGQHETGQWEYLLKPVINKPPKIVLR